MRQNYFLCLVLISVLLVTSSIASAIPEQSVCGVTTFYFEHNFSASIPAYEKLIPYPSGNTEVIENVTVTSATGPKVIDTYIIDPDILSDVIAIRSGIREYTTYMYVSTDVGTTRLNFTTFRRFSNGSEQEFYTTFSDDINSLTVSEYLTNYVVVNTLEDISTSDRIGVRVSAQTTQPSPVTVYFVYQGIEHASRFNSGYYVCSDPIIHSSNQSNSYGAESIVFGIIGGLVGSLIILRRIQR